MRCDCDEKFHGMENELRVDDGPTLNVDAAGKSASITVSVTMDRNCDSCGSCMKSTTFETEQEVDFGDLDPDRIDWESLELSNDTQPDEYESGGGRYKKNMLGFDMTVDVTGTLFAQTEADAKKGAPEEDFTVEVALHDEMQASAFDEQG